MAILLTFEASKVYTTTNTRPNLVLHEFTVSIGDKDKDVLDDVHGHPSS